jgi:hypothetical protein
VPDRRHAAKRRNKRPARLLLSPSSPLTCLCRSPCAHRVRRSPCTATSPCARRHAPLAAPAPCAPRRRVPPPRRARAVRPLPRPPPCAPCQTRPPAAPATRQAAAPLSLVRPSPRHRRCAPSPPPPRPDTTVAATRPQPSSRRLALNRRRARHTTPSFGKSFFIFVEHVIDNVIDS